MMLTINISKIFTIWIIFIIKFKLVAATKFEVYWNIPTFMCKNYQIYIHNNQTQQFNIIQNVNDEFRGNEIGILYDPGKFPAILQNSHTKKYIYRNHGIPQEGNLYEHLKQFQKHINELIPDPKFNGLAIIDFESWRPIFRQNFGTLLPYKNLSISIEKKLHNSWSMKHIQIEAKLRFEKSARIFMENTLLLAKELRPNAKWGYYAFPYCFNGRQQKNNKSGENPENCAPHINKENNQIQWLFDLSDIILPSVYLNEENLLPENRIQMVRGRITEAIRLNERRRQNPDHNENAKIYVYYRYLYTDTLNYLNELETFTILNTIKKSGVNGVILWGSSNDLNTKEKCEKFQLYFMNILGPVIHSIQQTSHTIN